MTKALKFTPVAQAAFAELSGDYNPLHVDPLLARRLLYGGPVVHGIHCLLWTLEAWLAERPDHIRLRSLEAAFFKPLRVGQEARVTHKLVGDWGVKAEIVSGETGSGVWLTVTTDTRSVLRMSVPSESFEGEPIAAVLNQTELDVAVRTADATTRILRFRQISIR